MTIFRHLVVGIDLEPGSGRITPGSAAALDHAGWLAAGAGSVRCTLLHSSQSDEFWNEGEQEYESFSERPDPGEALEAARQQLAQAGAPVAVEITEERAWLAVIRRVIEGPCDLVLVGKRNGTQWAGPPIGSQAAKLLRKCPSAVWAVRPGVVAPPGCVLAAVDLSPVGEKVLERSGRIAERAGAALHAVHAFQFTMAAQLGAGETGPEYAERVAREASTHIRERLRAVGFSGEPELHVGLTSPTRAILECEKRYAPDLVVMGTVSRGGVAGLLLGNTAERLLGRLDTSLLTLKPADFVCPVVFD